MEKFLERLMYSTRWLLAPIYLGLSLVLILLAIKFFQHVFHVFPVIMETSEADLVLPHQLVVLDVLGVHKDLEEMDRGNGDNRCRHLVLQTGGIHLAQPVEFF